MTNHCTLKIACICTLKTKFTSSICFTWECNACIICMKIKCSHSPRPSSVFFFIFPQESVIQPPREDSSIFYPQVHKRSCPALPRHWQSSQTQLREGSTLPQHHEPVFVSDPEGSSVSWEADVFWLGPVWKLSRKEMILADRPESLNALKSKKLPLINWVSFKYCKLQMVLCMTSFKQLIH